MDTPPRATGWCSTSPPASAGATNSHIPVSPTTSAVVLLEPCSLHDTIQDIRTLRSPRRKVKFTGSSDDDSICSTSTTCTQSSKNGRLRGITLDDLDFGSTHGVSRPCKTTTPSAIPTTIVQRKIARLKEKKERRRMKQERVSRKSVVKPSSMTVELEESLSEVLIRKQRLFDLSDHLRRRNSGSSRSLLSLEYPKPESTSTGLAAPSEGASTKPEEGKRGASITVESSQGDSSVKSQASAGQEEVENDVATDDSNSSDGGVIPVSERTPVDTDDTGLFSHEESPTKNEFIAAFSTSCNMIEAEKKDFDSELVNDVDCAAGETLEQADHLKGDGNAATRCSIIKPAGAKSMPTSSTNDSMSAEKDSQSDSDQDSIEKEIAESPPFVAIEPLNEQESLEGWSTTPVLVIHEGSREIDEISKGKEQSETLQNSTFDRSKTPPIDNGTLCSLLQLHLQKLMTELQKRDETILKLKQDNTKQNQQIQDLSQQLQTKEAYHEERLLQLQQIYDQHVDLSLEQVVGLSMALTETHVRADELTQQLLNYYYERQSKQEASVVDNTNKLEDTNIHEELARMVARQKQRIVKNVGNSSTNYEHTEENKDDKQG